MKHFIIKDFFSSERAESLLRFALEQEPNFVPTTTFTEAEDYRVSSVLYNLQRWAETVEFDIRGALPTVFDRLGIKPFSPRQIEMQLTAHSHNGFYKVHNDNGSPDTQTRQLTYVYYFWSEPKAFCGGELVVEEEVVQPDNNMMIFFPSGLIHEVKTVVCPSRDFASSRFTVNGWINV